MNASKEEAQRAIDDLNAAASLLTAKPGEIAVEAIKAKLLRVEEFVTAAQQRLPRESFYARKQSPESVELFVRSGSDYKIVDQHGGIYKVWKAKELYETGQVRNYNVAFHELATSCDWSIEKLKERHKR